MHFPYMQMVMLAIGGVAVILAFTRSFANKWAMAGLFTFGMWLILSSFAYDSEAMEPFIFIGFIFTVVLMLLHMHTKR